MVGREDVNILGNNEISTEEIRKLEGKDVRVRGPLVIETAQAVFKGTSLLEKGQIGSGEEQSILTFFEQVAPYAHPKLYPDFWLHSLATGVVAKHLAQKAGLNPHVQQVAGLIHDLSRIVVPHRYGRTDLFEKPFVHMVGIRQEAVTPLVGLEKLLGIPPHTLPRLELFTPPERITILADVLGKVIDQEGHLRSVEELRKTSGPSSRYKDTIWPSEKRYYEQFLRPEVTESYLQLLDDCVQWFQNEHGVDFDEVKRLSEAELQSQEYQLRYWSIVDAQETLDKEVDRKLKRPPITNIVFDMGGVLTETMEAEMAQRIAQQLPQPLDPKDIHKAILDMCTVEGTAGIIPNEDLLDKFWSSLGVTSPPDLATSEGLFYNPDVFVPVEGMQAVVDQLAKNDNLDLYILSDSISLVTQAVIESAMKLFPYFGEHPQNILVSSQMRSSKRGNDIFPQLLNRLGVRNPQQILFIDNTSEYVTSARAGYNIRGFTFRGNQYKGISSIERFRRELQKGNLI